MRPLLALVLLAGYAAALNDYWGKFCGKHNCYEALGLEAVSTCAGGAHQAARAPPQLMRTYVALRRACPPAAPWVLRVLIEPRIVSACSTKPCTTNCAGPTAGPWPGFGATAEMRLGPWGREAGAVLTNCVCACVCV
jgi:hypothetical protein